MVNETQTLLRYNKEFQTLFGEEEFIQRKEELLSSTKSITERLHSIVQYALAFILTVKPNLKHPLHDWCREQHKVKTELDQINEEHRQLKKRSEKEEHGEVLALSP